jgi:hypothetical protein
MSEEAEYKKMSPGRRWSWPVGAHSPFVAWRPGPLIILPSELLAKLQPETEGSVTESGQIQCQSLPQTGRKEIGNPKSLVKEQWDIRIKIEKEEGKQEQYL